MNPAEAVLIIVTGANGQLGRDITEQLLDRVPAAEIGVSVRDTAKTSAATTPMSRFHQASPGVI